MGIASWIAYRLKKYISHFAVFYIDLDQEDLYDGDVQRMTGDSRSVGLVVSSDNSFYFVYIYVDIYVSIYI